MYIETKEDKILKALNFKKETSYFKPTFTKILNNKFHLEDGCLFVKVTELKKDFKIELIKIRNSGSSPRQNIIESLLSSKAENYLSEDIQKIIELGISKKEK